MAREYIQLRATTDRERTLERVKDEAEVDGDAEAIDLALDAYLQLSSVADAYEERINGLVDEFNTRDGAVSISEPTVRRS